MFEISSIATSTYFYNASGTVDYVLEEVSNPLFNVAMVLTMVALFFIGFRVSIWFIKLSRTKN